VCSKANETVQKKTVKNEISFDLKSSILYTSILSTYQKGVYYSGIKTFNALPTAINDVSSKPNKFKIALKHFLLERSFYTLNECFDK
jgi:hypothetical protein